MKKFMIDLLKIVVSGGITWAIVVAFVKLITLCFGVEFSLRVATGVWLCLSLVKFYFPRKASDNRE